MTYCDFKAGDEVVCVDACADSAVFGNLPWANPLVLGAVYRVDSVDIHQLAGVAVARLVDHPNYCKVLGRDVGFQASRFRKVQRRKTDLSIEAFLTIKPGFEEPKRAPAPKKERVS